MIISQTPFRVSFAGGGTDLPAFCREEPGAVLSTTVNRHMYVTVHRRFEPNIRLAYSKTEIVDSPDELEHEIVREALRHVRIDEPLEITTIGDVPAGTGMGSSSTLTVGLLNALYAYKGKVTSAAQLAREASDIEINVLGKPIGRQDQYASAFGGLNFIRFNSDESVDVEPVPCRAETLEGLESQALMFYTNNHRSADAILQKQSREMHGKINVMRSMRDLAGEMRSAITGSADLCEFARLLHEGWELKRSLGFGISNGLVDEWYHAARKAGARGGKLLGAGGGGFLFLMAPPERHQSIRETLGRPREVTFEIDRVGSRIVFISEHH